MKYLLGIIIGIVLAGGGWYIAKERDHHDETHNADSHEDDHHHEVELTAKKPVRADGTFTISTSFYPLQFALERIAGSNADIINIGAGRDPHDFRPSTQAIRTLQDSDLVVLQGAGFEPWGEDVAAQLTASSIPLLFATDDLSLSVHTGDHHHDEETEAHHNDTHAQLDPHTWLDPVLFADTVDHLGEALATLDPEFATAYTANAEALQAELAALHTSYQTRLVNCAYDEAIISHDAFGYLASRYQLEMHPIAGLSTQDTPSATTLATLRKEAAAGVGAILLEDSSVTAYGETLARETGLTTLTINPIAFSVPEGSDYLSLMHDNLDTLVTAYACN